MIIQSPWSSSPWSPSSWLSSSLQSSDGGTIFRQQRVMNAKTASGSFTIGKRTTKITRTSTRTTGGAFVLLVLAASMTLSSSSPTSSGHSLGGSLSGRWGCRAFLYCTPSTSSSSPTKMSRRIASSLLQVKALVVSKSMVVEQLPGLPLYHSGIKVMSSNRARSIATYSTTTRGLGERRRRTVSALAALPLPSIETTITIATTMTEHWQLPTLIDSSMIPTITAPQTEGAQLLSSQLLLSTISPIVPPEVSSDVMSVSSSPSSSWRQYVPLVVSTGVLLDIVLGSPAANALLKILGAQAPPSDFLTGTTDKQQQQQRSSDAAQLKSSSSSRRERIDTMAVAQQTLNKAAATKELRRFLDENQTDWQKIAKLQREMDEQLAAFDNEKDRNSSSKI